MDLQVIKQNAPVTFIETDKGWTGPKEGVALCLSGGGYRAMVFHLGALIRLNEAGLLQGIKRVSSVSGGSITAGVLGLHWAKLNFADGRATNLTEQVVEPVCHLASHTIQWCAALRGLIWPAWAGTTVAAFYDKHLFHGATLQDLPSDTEGPRFVINATSLQTGVLWRFSKPYMADYRVGWVANPDLRLAVAVSASSGFPPFLSPIKLKFKTGQVLDTEGADLHQKPYTCHAILCDGGVYDNLGLETAWKSYKTILVSDGGAKMEASPNPRSNWISQVSRLLQGMLPEQIGKLRKRQLIGSYTAEEGSFHRDGTYWGIRSHVEDYKLADAFECPVQATEELAAVPTGLKALEAQLQERIINWGYAICDTAIRKHYNPNIPKGCFPFPNAGL